ncbi:hypothetical protein H2256_00670 [Campylobacter sp. RM9929]|uniref:hypothetical protein n=1 Tax=Campylobacter molothri TaxID=1032242 RepID=UPI001D7A5EA8|nr:hypothetical protein [Campylobacter sp. RM9929]
MFPSFISRPDQLPEISPVFSKLSIVVPLNFIASLLPPPCIVPSFLKFVSDELFVNSIAKSLLGLTEPLLVIVKVVLPVSLTVILSVFSSLTVPQFPLRPQPLI